MLACWFSLCGAGCPSSGVERRVPELQTAAHVGLVQPPIATRSPHIQQINGVELVDDYFWLRDRDDPGVMAYLESENEYTEAMMAHTEELQETLYQEILGHIQETDLTVPYRVDEYYYYSRTEEGLDYPLFCRRQGSLEGEEEVLLDHNLLAQGYDYLDVGFQEPSPDHQMLAYGVDTSGSEQYTAYFKDLRTGEVLAQTLSNITSSLAWGNDNRTVFYTVMDETYRPYRLYRYILGSDPDSAELLYQEDDNRFYLNVWKTRSEAFIAMSSASAVTSEHWVLDANVPDGAFRVIEPREQGVEYSIEHHSDRFYIVTNRGADGARAVNFRLMMAPVESPGRDRWIELIPHRPEIQLVGVSAFADYLVIQERAQGLPQLVVRHLATGEDHIVELPEAAYGLSPENNPEFDSAAYRFSYTSLVTPNTVFDYHMDTRRLEVLKERPVRGYDRAAYATERIWATAPDGVQVPISILYRRDLLREGPAPLLLEGYGAYGWPYDTYFSVSRLCLVDRGYIYALAHIRGGGELGRPWYEDGKLMAKRNTFTDFIAVAEHLIAQGYTSSDRLAITGASAGGLLIGAVTNMRPDLFAVVVAEVPFVDLINTMLDDSIPLTAIEWEEWGDPHETEAFDYMRSYSPYDNVREADYPAMLITAGLNDPRVGYWEPAKWAARLRATRTDDSLILLRTNMGAGHFGASGRYDLYREIAFEWAFILDQLGLEILEEACDD